MEFPDYDFTQLNETDIREEIVAPLLRYLGYRSGTKNGVVREQHLSYPKSSLGRKKAKDPILRGKADYICTAHGQINWVIEAKSPEADLDQDSQEQAWTYANHPEVRAVYFCLTTGKDFQVFQSDRKPDSDPIFKCRYDEMESKIQHIINLLSPDSILRDFPHMEVDTGEPIGPGLRSIVRATSGSFHYTQNTANIPALIGLTMTITEGSIQRDGQGRLQAEIDTTVPFTSLQELNKKLGLNSMILHSPDSVISIDSAEPTIFSSSRECVLPQGTKSLNLMTWQDTILPMTVVTQVETKAAGILENGVFHGEFVATVTYKGLGHTIAIQGKFDIKLS